MRSGLNEIVLSWSRHPSSICMLHVNLVMPKWPNLANVVIWPHGQIYIDGCLSRKHLVKTRPHLDYWFKIYWTFLDFWFLCILENLILHIWAHTDPYNNIYQFWNLWAFSFLNMTSYFFHHFQMCSNNGLIFLVANFAPGSLASQALYWTK